MSKEIDKSIQKFLSNKPDRRLDLSQYTNARLGLGHTGGHLPFSAWLSFQLGFAQAKDAVFSNFDKALLFSLCKEMNLPALEIESQAQDSMNYLLRPDLGKLLADSSKLQLEEMMQNQEYLHRDVLIIVSGGLSPIAIQNQIFSFLPILVDKIKIHHWSLAPIMINPRGRVALGDQVNAYCKARITVMSIGERPGLSTPDSMGIYFTYEAQPGCTDEQRNCISNIHASGLTHTEAAEKLINLMNKSMALHMSGFELKDDTIDSHKLK